MKKILNLGAGYVEDYGTHRADWVKTPITTEVFDINNKFPYPDNFFDEVYSNDVIEHIKNLDNFEKEIYRVLKKGGKIFIKTDYAGFLPYHLPKREHNKYLMEIYVNRKENHGDDGHYHLFVPSHLLKLFSRFRNLEVKWVYTGGNPIKKFILKSIPFHWGCQCIAIEGVK